MKLEEILPEIRKGRKYRPTRLHSWVHGISALCYIQSSSLFEGDDWELEPIPEPAISYVDAFSVYSQGNAPHGERIAHVANYYYQKGLADQLKLNQLYDQENSE